MQDGDPDKGGGRVDKKGSGRALGRWRGSGEKQDFQG